MTDCLLAEHVRKLYSKAVALADATLRRNTGEILALLGPNGAGKTTLIKILATLLKKDAGQVEIMGLDLERQEGDIRHLFGYVGQDTERSAYARLTVSENLHFFGSLRGLSQRQIYQRIESLAGYFDFQSNLNKLFVALSGGQKQTVVIMRALLHDPPLVYLDEPTRGLDPIVARKIRLFLKRLAQEEGKTLLLTSHILSEGDELADRVALIHHDVIPLVGTPGELKATVGATELVDVEKAALPMATLEKLSRLSQVLFTTERDPHWVSFGVKDALEGAEAIIHTLREDGVQARFRQHTVSLEDAFLHHIGELGEKFD